MNVTQLVQQKRQWAAPLSAEAIAQGFTGWRTRGTLPHFDAPGAIQFVTFRLGDALPAERRHEWGSILEIEDQRLRQTKIEAYLDRGCGGCHLRHPAVARLVEEAFLFFDEQRYRLFAWVLMPNHVHVLFEQLTEPLERVLHSWKSYTGKKAKRLLGLTEDFWQIEYFDRYIRDEEHYLRVRQYIESNPVRAGLAKTAEEWQWSSARRRATEPKWAVRVPGGYLPPRSAGVSPASD